MYQQILEGSAVKEVFSQLRSGLQTEFLMNPWRSEIRIYEQDRLSRFGRQRNGQVDGGQRFTLTIPRASDTKHIPAVLPQSMEYLRSENFICISEWRIMTHKNAMF